PPALEVALTELREAVEGAGPLGVDRAGLTDRQRAVLPLLDGITLEGGRIRPAEAVDPLADHPFVAALEAAPWAPPEPSGVNRAELAELVRRGLIVEREGVYFGPSAVDAAARRVAELLVESPEGVTVAQVRDGLGTTRKHALPLLAHFDATGVTRRRGDLRIGGPRLPPL
ncbi:MAG: SelB C-terminal domain-containing protein, partial [Acidimicrobiales bacterium]|nr:SelB C-terminal domain-containing protein [Acidimicrobiales bacterium]